MKNTDLEVISALKSGNDDAVLDFLYKKVFPKVKHYITSNKGTEDESKDIFQDAVVIFYKKIKFGDVPESINITAYICTIAKNLWLNSLRRTKKTERLTFEESFHTEEDYLGDLITEEKSTAIQNLLTEIGEECKTLLKYSIYDNFSMKEIAKLMGFSSEGVAKTYNYRCKQKLIKLVLNNKQIENLLRK